MLGVGNAATIERLWEESDAKAQLPEPQEKFFAVSGSLPERPGCQRVYERHFLRRKAIVKRHSVTLAVYTQDCSRMGLAFVSPVQLFPRERIKIWIDRQRCYELEIIRCRRKAENCYECGSVFILS